jgi:hypothetical protein
MADGKISPITGKERFREGDRPRGGSRIKNHAHNQQVKI